MKTIMDTTATAVTATGIEPANGTKLRCIREQLQLYDQIIQFLEQAPFCKCLYANISIRLQCIGLCGSLQKRLTCTKGAACGILHEHSTGLLTFRAA